MGNTIDPKCCSSNSTEDDCLRHLSLVYCGAPCTREEGGEEPDIEHEPVHKENTPVEGGAFYTGYMKLVKLKGANQVGFEFVQDGHGFQKWKDGTRYEGQWLKG